MAFKPWGYTGPEAQEHLHWGFWRRMLALSQIGYQSGDRVKEFHIDTGYCLDRYSIHN